MLQHAATHAAKHCNMLCNSLQRTFDPLNSNRSQKDDTLCNSLQYTATPSVTHRNSLQLTATHCNTQLGREIQMMVEYCNALQHKLQRTL